MSNFVKNFLWAVATLMFISFAFSLFIEPGKEAGKLSLSQLAAKINAREVSTIGINGDDLEIKLKDGTSATSKKEVESGLTETLKNVGVDPVALKDVEISVQSPGTWQFWAGILIPAKKKTKRKHC